jgi:hypothetical protein
VAALALAAIFLALQGADEPVLVTTTSTTISIPPTTVTGAASTSTSSLASTSTTTTVQRQVEVEALLKELWFGWFDAIYRKDPDALWEVVATTQFHDAGVAAMDTMEFISEPTVDGFDISDLEILLDRPDCLVAAYTIDPLLLSEPRASFVSVLWPDDRYGFRFATDWQYANDLWQGDCDNLERETTP